MTADPFMYRPSHRRAADMLQAQRVAEQQAEMVARMYRADPRPEPRAEPAKPREDIVDAEWTEIPDVPLLGPPAHE